MHPLPSTTRAPSLTASILSVHRICADCCCCCCCQWFRWHL